MQVRFEWQAGDETGRWETIARIEGRTRLKIPRWAWVVVLTSVVVLAGGGYAGLRRWHDVALQRIAHQIQSVIDLETRALARHDVELFLAQQDGGAPGWVERQAELARRDWLQADEAAVDGCTSHLPPGRQRGRPSERPAQVERVELRGDTAWVEVIAGREPVRQARFYRQTDSGWLHTAPDVQFWGERVTLQHGDVLVHCYERDLAHAEPLAEQIHALLDDVRRTLGCPPDSVLEVDLAIGARVGELFAYSQGTLTLPSPWLPGIAAEGGWSQERLEELRHWVAYAATAQFLGRGLGVELDLLQRAVLAEVADWYAHQDPAHSPLLRRVAAQHGMDALPEVLHDLREPRSLSWFVERWLSLAPADAEAILFETLLNVEREAILAGQRDTFLLVQESGSRWMALQEAHYDDIQSGQVGFCFAPARVEGIEVAGGHAFVTLREQTSLDLDGRGARSVHRVEVFSLQDGGWKRGWRAERPQR